MSHDRPDWTRMFSPVVWFRLPLLVDVQGVTTTTHPTFTTYGPFDVSDYQGALIRLNTVGRRHRLDLEWYADQGLTDLLANSDFDVWEDDTLRLYVPHFGPWFRLRLRDDDGSAVAPHTHDLWVENSNRNLPGVYIPEMVIPPLQAQGVSVAGGGGQDTLRLRPYAGWVTGSLNTGATSFTWRLRVGSFRPAAAGPWDIMRATRSTPETFTCLIPQGCVEAVFTNNDAGAKTYTAALIPVSPFAQG